MTLFADLSNRKISDRITKWFHARDSNHFSPSFVVSVVHSKFLNLCTSMNLNLSLSAESFKESLSEATCVMYYATQMRKGWDGPHRNVLYPQNWTNEYEEIWLEYLHNRAFPQEWWDRFWAPIPVDPCETAVPGWTDNLQTVLPYYILRDIGVLVSSGLILEPTKTRVTDANHVQEEDEYYDSS